MKLGIPEPLSLQKRPVDIEIENQALPDRYAHAKAAADCDFLVAG